MTLIISVLLGFIAVCGFRYEVTDDYLKLTNTYSFFWLMLFCFFVWALYRAMHEKDRPLLLCSALFALIISTFSSFGVSIAKMHRLSWIWESKGYLVNFLNLYYGRFILYFCFGYTVYGLLKGREPKDRTAVKQKFSFGRVLLWWGILLLFFIPWYLLLYPGILTPDSGAQVRDAITVNTLIDHHSAFLDLVLRGILLPVRHWTGSLQTAVGITMLLQMLIVTFAFAWCYEWIRRYLSCRALRLFAFLWFAVYPLHPIYSVTMWKDILFSISFLFLMLCLDSAAADEDAFFTSVMKKLALFLTLLLLPLMRHNGLSITVVMTVYLFFRFRRYRRQAAVICGCALAAFGIWKFVLLPAMNVTGITPAHVYSVQEQQIVRILDERRDELTEDELAELESYFDIPEIWNVYNPILSDPVKVHFRNSRFNEDPGKFFSLWLDLGKRYPLTYLESVLMNNFGYWYPELNYWYSDFGVVQVAEIEDIHSAPILRIGVVESVFNWFRSYGFLKIPMGNLLFSPAACFWVWIFCGIYCLYRNRKKFILFIPGFALWLGILVTPINNDFRYVYGLFTALPLLLAAGLTKQREE
ncbi:MAG: hypothetical protein IJI07_09445 [Flexilinea sp.]|nr:hypothetical protein [Flexilinea sp.]